MVSRIKTDGSAVQTGRLMHLMVDRYHQDMLPYVHLPLGEVYDIIKRIPYREDPLTEETLQRPTYTLNGMGWGGDCDDKCIALASYCRLAGIPCRFVAARKPNRPALHHVFCECYIPGSGWVTADPTYSFNILGRERGPFLEKRII